MESDAMTSQIDPTVPIYGDPTTASVRQNFQTAADEITALQAALTSDVVTSFNSRDGAVILQLADITGAGGAPLTSPNFAGSPAAPTPAVGDNDTSVATTAFVQTAVAPTLHNTGRNLLHNSLFNIAQRGAGPFTALGFTLDRWGLSFTNDTLSLSRITLTDADRSAIGDESAIYAAQITFTGNAAAASYSQFIQSIESVHRLSGKTVTLSLWAKATSGAPKLGLNTVQVFGTGGSPSAPVNATAVAVTLSTTWTRYSATFTLPSTAGKTLGTNGGDFTQCALWLSSGSTNAGNAGNIGVQSGTMAFFGLQLEIGTVATPLEKPDPQVELAKCLRFYFTTTLRTDAATPSGTYGVSSSIALPVPMRASPTIAQIGNGSTNLTSITYSALSTQVINVTGTAGGGAYALLVSFSASADL
jgi:hypothetical protein